MEQNLRDFTLRWNILRAFAVGIATATNILTLGILPRNWWLSTIPMLVIGLIVAALAVAQWKSMWIWLTLLVQAFLFILGLSAAIFGFVAETSVPVLLIAFTLILTTEHILTAAASYSPQFSIKCERAILEFNLETYAASLNHLYRRLARNALIFATGFLISILVVSLGAISPAASILSDPSLYIVVASISLAALLTVKEH